MFFYVFFFLIKTFIQKGTVKLIKSDSKTKDFHFK